MCQSIKTTIDIAELRKTLGVWTTGVAVASTRGADGSPVGMTINSLVSISLDPPLLGWCIDRRSASFDVFSRCSDFLISVLGHDQADLARRFATRGADKFADIEEIEEKGAAGSVPRIPGAIAWIRCRLYRCIPLGDHLMLVGEVQDFAAGGCSPLVFSRGALVSTAVVGGAAQAPISAS
ncbi:hypothetical protein GCM10011348_15030 [Marinobacterium nitratireducens]|uniref:Flavin reductase like domain-containing protein n=1 Tax=Marinobacterium nitratireducens TaxID=518897 RepID=A0A917ZD83_9GAMM|nr:flavin reductase family protein [Marinobacterium nitratireducens]GGO79804.1 hypothetical protein GCM10011348_15030 [Marinobacterium nitratireducens]